MCKKTPQKCKKIPRLLTMIVVEALCAGPTSEMQATGDSPTTGCLERARERERS